LATIIIIRKNRCGSEIGSFGEHRIDENRSTD
jgi:hypothetical protein